MPSRQVSCNFQIDAVIGAPLADVGPNGSFYSQDSRGANGKPSGPNMLIRANNGGEGDGQCVSPPTATAQFSCWLLDGRTGAIVTVTNPDSDDSAIVDIEKNGTVVVNDLTVAPSGTATGNVPFVNGETATVSVVNTFNGDEIYSHSFTANCLNPQATATKSCVAGGVQVHLSNLDATESATFSVSVDGPVTPHPVAAGPSEDFTVPVADHATAHGGVVQGERRRRKNRKE